MNNTNEKYTAEDVARYVVWYSSEILKKPITEAKLEQILYLIQLSFLKCTGNVCFNDDIAAWETGPTIYSVRKKYTGLLDPFEFFENEMTIYECLDLMNNQFRVTKSGRLIRRIVSKCSHFSISDLSTIINSQNVFMEALTRGKQGHNYRITLPNMLDYVQTASFDSFLKTFCPELVIEMSDSGNKVFKLNGSEEDKVWFINELISETKKAGVSVQEMLGHIEIQGISVSKIIEMYDEILGENER